MITITATICVLESQDLQHISLYSAIAMIQYNCTKMPLAYATVIIMRIIKSTNIYKYTHNNKTNSQPKPKLRIIKA